MFGKIEGKGEKRLRGKFPLFGLLIRKDKEIDEEVTSTLLQPISLHIQQDRTMLSFLL